MKKACFIIPYFGKFNNYFQLFLNSCSRNLDFDWLIFTDDRGSYLYPDNVQIIYITFPELRDQIQKKFSFEIALDRPYKLCDFKPAYGYIFEEYLAAYPFWGHCDTDMIWGQISHFITENDWKSFDKIGILGHCTLYRNVCEISRLFMTTARHKEVYSDQENCSFDEEFCDSINGIFIAAGKRVDMREHQANLYTKSSDFRLVRYNGDHSKYLVEDKKKGVFVWNEGVLTRYLETGNGLESMEYMYLHMQARPMQVRISSRNIFKIIPNAFEDLEVSAITAENIGRIKSKNFNLHYFRLRSHNLKLKIQKRLKNIKRRL